jgi:hypothetical protein
LKLNAVGATTADPAAPIVRVTAMDTGLLDAFELMVTVPGYVPGGRLP